MTPAERKQLDKLDKLVLGATPDDLKKIQEADMLTQIEGESFYDVYINSESLVNPRIERKF